jgi:UDP-N-acetylmuramoyl-L-alanyl-D-glutamate--2,6-diaminopimelate ligase
MVAAGDGWAVVEASSHGLAQDRVGEVAWDVAVLTNVTEEHLEFHHTIEAYLAAKLRLFEALVADHANPEKGFGKTAVLNLDDGAAEMFATAARASGATVGVWIPHRGTWVASKGVADRLTGAPIQRPMQAPIGSVTKTFTAVAAVAAVGEALDLVEPSRRPGGRRGRARPDGTHRCRATVRRRRRLRAYRRCPGQGPRRAGSHRRAWRWGAIAVFGSAGDRDRVKRPAMGHVAGLRCRLVVLTDEHPRTGIGRPSSRPSRSAPKRRAGGAIDLPLVPDRRWLIRTAIAQRGADVVLLAGKGHEKST